MVQAPAAASGGIEPFATQISVSGFIGSISRSESKPNKRATVMKWQKHAFKSVHPLVKASELMECQKGSTQWEW